MTREYFNAKGRIMAIACPAEKNVSVNHIEFYTPLDCPLQVGRMQRPAGHIAPPHRHLLNPRLIDRVCEVLYVVHGKIRVTLIDDWEMQYVDLSEGDSVILIEGGHSVEFLEKSEVFEVKQGPYVHGMDKIQLPPF